MADKPQMTEAQLREMVSHIQDPTVRQHYENVIGGVIVKEVVCLGSCNGRVVGHYYADGQLIEVKSEFTVTETETEKNEEGEDVEVSYDRTVKSGCLSSRQRLDGHMGYLCECGNDSRLSDAEKGVIGETAPTKGDLAMVLSRLNEKPTDFKAENGVYEVDGFVVRPYSGGTK